MPIPVFLEFDAYVPAGFLALLMLVGWKLGTLRVARGANVTALTRFDDGALALFGLLLAFCFSGAAARYDARKRLVLEEATAIGDFAGTLAVLAEPERTQLVRELHGYMAQRLEFGQMRFDDPGLQSLTASTRTTQDRISALVTVCVQRGNTPTVHEPLIQTLNAMTTAYESRAQGLRDHIPGTIVFMLMAFGVFSTFTVGGSRLWPAVAYIALVALVFWVTLDLEMPRRGFVRVSQQPMQEIAAHLPSP
jgi:hypothetical protein